MIWNANPNPSRSCQFVCFFVCGVSLLFFCILLICVHEKEAKRGRKIQLNTTAKKKMMLGLGIVFKASLLIVNAMAIIHEERFLRKGKEHKKKKKKDPWSETWDAGKIEIIKTPQDM